MRTRVASFVGLLMFGYAGSSRAAFPADSPEQLIRIAVPSVAGGAVVGTYGGPSALERQPEAAP